MKRKDENIKYQLIKWFLLGALTGEVIMVF